MKLLLLKGGTVLIHGHGDKVSEVKADILVEGDRITKVENGIAPPNDADIIDCTDTLVSPGFIDTHHHVWQAPLKGLFSDCSFSRYLGISKEAIAGTISSGIRSVLAYTPTVRLEEYQPQLRFDDKLMAKWIMDTFEELAKFKPLNDQPLESN